MSGWSERLNRPLETRAKGCYPIIRDSSKHQIRFTLLGTDLVARVERDPNATIVGLTVWNVSGNPIPKIMRRDMCVKRWLHGDVSEGGNCACQIAGVQVFLDCGRAAIVMVGSGENPRAVFFLFRGPG